MNVNVFSLSSILCDERSSRRQGDIRTYIHAHKHIHTLARIYAWKCIHRSLTPNPGARSLSKPVSALSSSSSSFLSSEKFPLLTLERMAESSDSRAKGMTQDSNGDSKGEGDGSGVLSSTNACGSGEESLPEGVYYFDSHLQVRGLSRQTSSDRSSSAKSGNASQSSSRDSSNSEPAIALNGGRDILKKHKPRRRNSKLYSPVLRRRYKSRDNKRLREDRDKRKEKEEDELMKRELRRIRSLGM